MSGAIEIVRKWGSFELRSRCVRGLGLRGGEGRMLAGVAEMVEVEMEVVMTKAR